MKKGLLRVYVKNRDKTNYNIKTIKEALNILKKLGISTEGQKTYNLGIYTEIRFLKTDSYIRFTHI
tara:strand:+ start:3843 stop:4040 length:198 start_codon:yes stop_codon:yes gene_type:complete